MTQAAFDAKQYQKRSHTVAGCVCVAVACIQYFASSGRIATIRSEWETVLITQQQLLNQAGAAAERLTALTAQEQQLTEQLQHYRRRIPVQSGDQVFFEQLADEAEVDGMTIQDFRPGDVSAYQGHQRATLAMSAKCTYSQLCTFLARLRKMERLCSIDACKVHVPERFRDELQLELTLSVFSSAPEVLARTEMDIRQ